jgi:hypothetical protein
MATVKKSIKKAQVGDSLSKKKPYNYKVDSAAKKPYYKLDVPEVRKKATKAQNGKDVPKGYVRGEMTNKLYKKEVMDKWEKGMGDALNKASKYAPKGVDSKIKNAYGTPSKPTSTGKKAKSGGSFPDLNKDGKITKADILKGRGVIAKKGASVSKKCKYGCK